MEREGRKEKERTSEGECEKQGERERLEGAGAQCYGATNKGGARYGPGPGPEVVSPPRLSSRPFSLVYSHIHDPHEIFTSNTPRPIIRDTCD